MATRSHRLVLIDAGPYDEMRRAFRWEVPGTYNIAADVLDKHEPSRPAMYWEDWEGTERTLTFGDMQAPHQPNGERAPGLRGRRGRPHRRHAAAIPEAAAAFLATYKLGGILLSLSVLYGDDSTGTAPRTRSSSSVASGYTRVTSPAQTTMATSGTRAATTT
jgi:acetyl-CoA synthetase